MEATTLISNKRLCRHLLQVQQTFIVWGMAQPFGLFDKEEFYESCRELHKDEEDCGIYDSGLENVPEGL